jgi:hypothetical protein
VRTVGFVVLRLMVVALIACAAGTAAPGARDESRLHSRRHERRPAGYVASVKRALKAGQDVWATSFSARRPARPTWAPHATFRR